MSFWWVLANAWPVALLFIVVPYRRQLLSRMAGMLHRPVKLLAALLLGMLLLGSCQKIAQKPQVTVTITSSSPQKMDYFYVVYPNNIVERVESPTQTDTNNVYVLSTNIRAYQGDQVKVYFPAPTSEQPSTFTAQNINNYPVHYSSTTPMERWYEFTVQ